MNYRQQHIYMMRPELKKIYQKKLKILKNIKFRHANSINMMWPEFNIYKLWIDPNTNKGFVVQFSTLFNFG